ncbi:hypothetical protein CTAYLR_001312 [Chrysophaeum taylorii]|uniref:Uncharacterized protein n=1 Tax=Chrysophaeum taylorii TaxID=2483200 RepID=A0AAD7U796_9STRA|nr:hypothetical protein CTAYLR_001312 [Chrysophaeum taylorii]
MILLLSFLPLALGAVDEYEWSGVFELATDEIYAWTASKVDEVYVDPTMRFVAVEGDSAEEVVLEDGECQDVVAGDTIIVPTNGCLRLIFDQDVYTSIFPLVVNASAVEESHDEDDHEEDEHDHEEDEHDDHEEDEHDHEEDEHDDHEEDEHDDHEEDEHDHDHEGVHFVIFAEHYPVEFEADSHYLKDSHGHDIEPESTTSSSGGSGGSNRRKAYRRSISASFLVLACTVIGIIVRIPALWGDGETYLEFIHSRTFALASSALACGALLAVAVYLCFFEATHLIQARWSEETQATWRFGTMILAGFATGCFVTLFCDPSGMHSVMKSLGKGDLVVTQVVEEDGKSKDVGDTVKANKIHVPLVMSIFLGDFLHNFVDGVVIAQAFLDCKVSRGWTVASATVYHELAQEISDFALLINVAGLSVTWALVVNFLSGTSVVFGVIAYMATKPGDGGQGLLLAYAGGTYAYLGATQAAHQFIYDPPTSLLAKLNVAFFFLLGAVAIGLVLLDHEHCTGDDGGDGGGHHGHAHL